MVSTCIVREREHAIGHTDIEAIVQVEARVHSALVVTTHPLWNARRARCIDKIRELAGARAPYWARALATVGVHAVHTDRRVHTDRLVHVDEWQSNGSEPCTRAERAGVAHDGARVAQQQNLLDPLPRQLVDVDRQVRAARAQHAHHGGHLLPPFGRHDGDHCDRTGRCAGRRAGRRRRRHRRRHRAERRAGRLFGGRHTSVRKPRPDGLGCMVESAIRE